MELTEGRPSPADGARGALRLWKLVVAVWFVPVVALLPARMVLGARFADGVSRLPGVDVELPPGDVLLVLRDGLLGAGTSVWPLLLLGLVVVWAWTLLWHGGVLGWTVWAGQGRPRLAELLGLGLLWWGRMLRLSLTALAVLLVLLAAVWMVVFGFATSRWEQALDGGLLWMASAGLAATAVIRVVVWSATLRGAWLLARPDARSSVLAWLRGLAGVARHPVSTLGVLVLWLIPAVAVSALPLAAGWAWAEARGGALAVAVQVVAGLLSAACWVGLFVSFAPVSGLVGDRSPDDEDEPHPAPREPDEDASPSREELRRRVVAELPRDR